MSSIVFDATALIHFSRAGRLREPQASAAEDEAILLAHVSAELQQGGPLRPTLDSATAAWLKPADLSEMEELAAFANYKNELGGPPERNNGEAGVCVDDARHLDRRLLQPGPSAPAGVIAAQRMAAAGGWNCAFAPRAARAPQ
jgi:hypothetical protein